MIRVIKTNPKPARASTAVIRAEGLKQLRGGDISSKLTSRSCLQEISPLYERHKMMLASREEPDSLNDLRMSHML